MCTTARMYSSPLVPSLDTTPGIECDKAFVCLVKSRVLELSVFPVQEYRTVAGPRNNINHRP